jgi:hypothetical protein
MGIIRQIESRVQRTDEEIKKALHQDIVYYQSGKISIGEFVTCFNTKFTGFKINLMKEEQPDFEEQKRIEKYFQEKLKIDSDNWIKNNVPQLNFPPQKHK